jgi:LmbE family N-acetylglucosaminyl deacetylase
MGLPGPTRRQFLRTTLRLAGASFLSSAAWVFYHPWNPVRASSLRLLDGLPNPGLSVGIVAPHPDDETLGAGGVAQRAVAEGCRVSVLLLTLGDGFKADAARVLGTLEPGWRDYRALGTMRLEESRRALDVLGVGADALTALAFPDRGSEAIWAGPWERRFRSPYTQADAVPYAGLPSSGTPYTGSRYLAAIRSWLQAVRPDVLLLPHPDDGHPDHRGGYAFTLAALQDLAARGEAWAARVERLAYLVHWGVWPLPLGYHPGVSLVPPSQLVGVGEQWEDRPLDEATRERKHQAILAYRSQMALIGDFLLAFCRRNELFDRDPDRQVPVIASPADLVRVAPAVHNPRLGMIQGLRARSADFGPVAVARSGEDLWVRVGFALASPPADVTARVELLAFGPGGDARGITLRARVSPPSLLSARGFGPTPDLKVDAQVSGDGQGGLRFRLPLAALGDVRRFVLGVRSEIAGRPAAACGHRGFAL